MFKRRLVSEDEYFYQGVSKCFSFRKTRVLAVVGVEVGNLPYFSVLKAVSNSEDTQKCV